MRAQLIRNTESALIKLRRHKLRAQRIAIYLRGQDFKTTGIEAELDRSTSSGVEMIPLVSGLFDKLFEERKLYRLTGLVLFKLEPESGGTQYGLFDPIPQIQSFKRIDKVIDEVNERYGKHSLTFAASTWLKIRPQHRAGRKDLPERKKILLPGENFRQHLSIPVWNLNL